MEQRVQQAKGDRKALSQLLCDYLPFLKKQACGQPGQLVEYDDRLSISMVVFVNCVRQYEPGKGSFLSFCAASIKNRLIDEERKQKPAHVKLVSWDEQETQQDKPPLQVQEQLSLQSYQAEQERQALSEELEAFAQELEAHSITMAELPRICPKQRGSREQCCALARAVVEDERLRKAFLERGQLPQAALASRFSLSRKTLEKHRKYIVAIVLLLLGDYPAIQAFLPLQWGNGNA